MDKLQKSEMYKTYLVGEGYKPDVDKDGDIAFKREGRWLLIIIDGGDEEYFQLAYPNFWKIESEEERQIVVSACALVTSKTKVVKVYPVKDNVWASFEIVLPKPEDFKAVFPRAVDLLESGVRKFVDYMRERTVGSGEATDAVKQSTR
jgi:hypothetical protein